MLWSTDSCQNRVSADKYSMTVWRVQFTCFFEVPLWPVPGLQVITGSTLSGLLFNGYKLFVWSKLQTCLRELRLWFWLNLYIIEHLLVIILICLVYVSRWTKYLAWVYFPVLAELDGLHRGEFWQLHFDREPCIYKQHSTRQLCLLSGKRIFSHTKVPTQERSVKKKIVRSL